MITMPRLPRAYRLLLYIIVGALFYQVIAILLLNSSERSSEKSCQVPVGIREELKFLLKNVHHVLETLQLSHFLCYDTLWGSINTGKLLPWQDTAEFCIFNEELLGKLDEGFIVRSFHRHNLTLTYDSGYGVYTVKHNQSSGVSLQLIVFEKDTMTNMMRRVGWRHRLLPPDCDTSPSLNCFPPSLVSKPLPEGQLEGMSLPVPKESIEIQKYLFPDSWWKEQKPSHCKG